MHTNTNNKCYQSAFKQVFQNSSKDIWRMEPHNCKSCQMTARNGVKLGPEMKTHSPLAYGSYNDKQGSITRFNTYQLRNGGGGAAHFISHDNCYGLGLCLWLAHVLEIKWKKCCYCSTLFQLEWYALAVAIYYYYLHFDDCLVI